MEAPFIVIFGLHISEPMTLITDYIIAVMGICFWKRLFDIESSQKNVARNLWAICFLILSFAAFLGGTHHGFSYYLTPALNKAIWQITVYSTGVISFLFVTGTATGFFHAKIARIWSWIAGVKLLIYLTWVTFHPDFLYVVKDYLPSMIAILVFSAIAFVKEKNASSMWLAAGVMGSLIGAVFQVRNIAPHEYFNHNDLYHVIQMGALYLFYRGARIFREKEED